MKRKCFKQNRSFKHFLCFKYKIERLRCVQFLQISICMKKISTLVILLVLIFSYQNCGKIGDTSEFSSLSTDVSNADNTNSDNQSSPPIGSDDQSNISKILFYENFDATPDWSSSVQNPTIPSNWSYKRVEDYWNPSSGDSDRHDNIQILSSNSSKAKGETGKSFVAYRESYDPGWKKWNSDSTFLKHFPGGYAELYVSFWIRFSPNWTYEGTSKIFRVFSWNEENPNEIFKFFSDGNSGPIYLWDYSHSTTYGIRNAFALRGGPPATHYSFGDANIEGLPRGLNGLGDMSLNFTADTKGMGPMGRDPKITDKLNGGFISDDFNQTVKHEQIYGKAGTWTKIAFYVKMNSSPNATDGVLMQWIDDELTFNNSNIPWVRGDSATKMVKWNVVGIGGNDFFRSYPNDQRHEEWYSIDDVLIHSGIPDHLPTPNKEAK